MGYRLLRSIQVAVYMCCLACGKTLMHDKRFSRMTKFSDEARPNNHRTGVLGQHIRYAVLFVSFRFSPSFLDRVSLPTINQHVLSRRRIRLLPISRSSVQDIRYGERRLQSLESFRDNFDKRTTKGDRRGQCPLGINEWNGCSW